MIILSFYHHYLWLFVFLHQIFSVPDFSDETKSTSQTTNHPALYIIVHFPLCEQQSGGLNWKHRNKTVICSFLFVPPAALRLARRAAQRRSSPALPGLQLHRVVAAGWGGFRGAGQAAAAPGGPGQTFPPLAPCRRVNWGATVSGLVQLPLSRSSSSASAAAAREERAVQRRLRAEGGHRHGLLLCLQAMRPQSHQHGIRRQGEKRQNQSQNKKKRKERKRTGPARYWAKA